MSAVSLNITQSDIQTVTRGFLLSILDQPIEVIAAQANRVPEPLTSDFVVMTPLNRVRQSTNTDTWDETIHTNEVLFSASPMTVSMQLDIHGPNSADNAQKIATLWRDYDACDFFTASGIDMQPLYTTDPRQMPFVNAEEQFELRWMLDAYLEANIVAGVKQAFADTLYVNIDTPIDAIT
jgi:hypothetical protein